jgi:hypothetical protein
MNKENIKAKVEIKKIFGVNVKMKGKHGVNV